MSKCFDEINNAQPCTVVLNGNFGYDILSRIARFVFAVDLFENKLSKSKPQILHSSGCFAN